MKSESDIKQRLAEASRSYREQIVPVENSRNLPLYVKAIPAGAVLEWQRLCQQDQRTAATAMIVAESLCDETGHRVYDDGEAEQVLDLPPGLVTDIAHAALVLAGVIGEGEGDEDEAAGKPETSGSGTN